MPGRFHDGTNVRRNVALIMSVLARLLRNQFDKGLEEMGMNRPQWTAIATASRYPGSTQRIVAETLEMSEAAAGRIIDQLCSQGLLTRQPKHDDKRAYSVLLTQAALPLLDQGCKTANILEARTFQGLDDTEIAQLNALLERVLKNVTD